MPIRGFRRAAPRLLTDAEAEQVLAMVEVAAREVALDEYEDTFGEYSRLLRSVRVVPGAAVRRRADKSAAGIAEAGIFLGVGLGLLGQVAIQVLTTAEDMAITKGLASAAEYLKKVIRGKDEVAVDEVAARVIATIEVPAGTDPALIKRVVRIQVEVLSALSAEPQSPDSSR